MMKKSMLCAGLMTILSATAFAEGSNHPKSVKATHSQAKTAIKKGVKTTKPSIKTLKAKRQSVAASAKKPVTKTPISAAQKLAANSPPPASSTQAPAPAAATQAPAPTATQAPAPAATTQAPTPMAATQTPTPAAATQAPAQPLNCNYRIPASTSRIEQTIVMKWAEKAAEQSFDFDYKTIDDQIAKLKACYTEPGWTGFNDALEKSGNLNAIKSQQLTVSPMVNGQSKIAELKDNQWKVSVPMQVVYQNEKEKLTQPLTVDLLVGRKPSGDLGIMQMIAIPAQNTQPSAPAQ